MSGGTDAAVHLLRALTDADSAATMTQIDGVGTFDHVSRTKMFAAVARLSTALRSLPFLRLTYGQLGNSLWHDIEGRCREMRQNE